MNPFTESIAPDKKFPLARFGDLEVCGRKVIRNS